MSYFVYMLKCVDGSYYLGTTNDVEKRFKAHVTGKGASYTRSHRPLNIVYTEEVLDKSTALKREHELRKLTHAQKDKLLIT